MMALIARTKEHIYSVHSYLNLDRIAVIIKVPMIPPVDLESYVHIFQWACLVTKYSCFRSVL